MNTLVRRTISAAALAILLLVSSSLVGVVPAQAAAVTLTPTVSSTTGVPMHELPASLFGRGDNLNAINENNWVAGTLAGRAVIWRGLTEYFEPIPRPTSASVTMQGLGLNDAGTVVGEWMGSFGSLPFRWQDEVTTFLPQPPLQYAGGRAAARDVDEDGNVLVFYDRDNRSCGTGPNIAYATAVLRPPHASVDYEQVRTAYCQNEVSGQAIDAGVVVGRVSTRFATENVIDSAFEWDGGVVDEQTDLTGDWTPRASADGWAVGTIFVSPGVVHAALDGLQGLQDLGTLGGPSSTAYGVNSLGWVVGSSETASGETHAFLWKAEDGMTDLGTLGGTTSRAMDINDQGNIVGLAAIEDGRQYGVIWMPPADTNQAPSADAGGPYVVAAGTSLSLDGTRSSDPDGDALSYDWKIEGTSATGATATLTAPATAGLYVLTLTVTDPAGDSSTASAEVAVYDPEAGSVTGAGWFTSPEGAIAADPSATGKAKVGFHVAYKKGRSVPDGHARLHFEAGQLRLVSESFEWLVVSSDQARFRGLGYVEGSPDAVTFEMLTGTSQEIRIRIWDDGGLAYDTGEVELGGGRTVMTG